MGLVIALLLLLLLTGGIGFGGFVALGSLAILVKILFALILISFIVALIRHFAAGPPSTL